MNTDTRYLENELAEYRWREERRQEDARREREQRDRERKEEMEQRARSADSWPEALRKQIHLFGREIAQEAAAIAEYGPMDGGDKELDDFFADGRAACERALAIWAEVEKEKAEKRAELQRQLAALDEELKQEVADRLESESKRIGWMQVANAIRADDPERWLDCGKPAGRRPDGFDD